ncbi:hypothetical protein MMC13_006510 [Lambiella insularis]|nr:hypothetical protein [Lambiella insularis]
MSPRPAQEPRGGVALPPTPAQCASKFDLAIALTLAAWPALSLAVANLWGGPLSSEKRDWFAGAVSTLLEETPDADVDYVEEFLLQVMLDEFEVNVDDSSAEEVAAKILGLRKLCAKGDFGMVDEMFARWEERRRRGVGPDLGFVEGKDEGLETDWDSEDEDGAGEGVDVEMGEAPGLGRAIMEKPPPEVDEEGFIKVVGKKRR